MPLTSKGKKILGSMEETYGSEKKAKSVLYASKNAGKITGIDQVVGTLASFAGRSAVGAAIGQVATPFSTTPTPTASQSQENSVMGRPAGTGALGAPATDQTMQQSVPNAGVLPASTTQQFGNNPTGLTPPAGGAGNGRISTTSFTRGSDTVVATAKDLARAAGGR